MGRCNRLSKDNGITASWQKQHFRQVCKEALFAVKNELVCMQKKPCLECKQGFFSHQAFYAAQNSIKVATISIILA